ncbi:LysR family transcriptional regulator [Variovorax sp. WS11]|uniref:LysR family transcriptional regulator n=1 Tax=Variovorax sp. WS11 TaxID=1105204 RepID=UPI000D0D6737|nr:LysR substrate-binding domain-containing protein [Variovorax sp. WS11]NDZ18843.1 LysR family transcriptional regulator [Variovorax sp. WS11]PSL79364.1 LysR family transcriptional regulator [Variovorax sp. WS11]
MELRHLRYFVAAAEEQHFGRAAEKLHVTRPAVSKIIADLEDELGMMLFERRGHRVTLTPAGKRLLPDVKSVMIMLIDAFKMARKVSEGKAGNLSVGYGALTLHNTLFRESIKQFKDAHPDVALTLVELATHAQLKAVSDGRIDAGFMHFGTLGTSPQHKRNALVPMPDKASLDWLTIENGHLGVLMEESHRFAGKKSLALSDLANERFIVVPKSSASPGYGMLHLMCQQAGFEPHVEQEVDSFAAMFNLVSVNIGIALCVRGRNFTYPRQLRVVPLRQVDYSTDFIVGWLKGQTNPLVAVLVETVRRVAGLH